MFQIIKNSIAVFLSILLFQGLLFPMEEGITKAYPLFSSTYNSNKNSINIKIVLSIPTDLTIEMGDDGTTSLRCPYCNELLSVTPSEDSKSSEKNSLQRPSRLREKFTNTHLLRHEQETILQELNKIPDQLENNFQNDLEKIINGKNGSFRTIKKCIFKNCKCASFPSSTSLRRHIMSHVHFHIGEKSVSSITKKRKKKTSTNNNQTNLSDVNNDVKNFEKKFLEISPDDLENQEEINKVVNELESLLENTVSENTEDFQQEIANVAKELENSLAKQESFQKCIIS